MDSKILAIPARFRNCTFATYRPRDSKQQHAWDILADRFTASYFLWGDFGSGKTHLLTAQYRKLVEMERPAMLMSMAELLNELRKAELDMDYFCQVRMRVRYDDEFHLLLDDIDKFKGTDFKFEVLFDFIDTLYRRNLSLSVSSNFSQEGLVESEALHPAIVRRILDICQELEV